jgi:biotin carboxylase
MPSPTDAGGRERLTVLCLATYLKGHDFLRECRALGCRVLLLTVDSLADADWPRDAIDDMIFVRRDFSAEETRRVVSRTARTERFDRIVALDDFDVETAAMLREHLRIPGMGETTARHFRDKLAMRVRAREAGIAVPDFIHVLNHRAVADWIERVPPPWVMKPRSQAAAIGIKKVADRDALWRTIEQAGDAAASYVLERFVPGEVYHADSIVFDSRILFDAISQYGRPPMQIAHEGGVFVTRTLPPDSADARALSDLNRQVLEALRLARGVSHTEFIRGADGRWYFLETSARVGGAYIADVVEAATGVNLWREWARLEVAGEHGQYRPPEPRRDAAGIVLTLARQEQPDTSAYTDPEIVRRIVKRQHAGLIVASPDPRRVESLLEQYARRFMQDFFASAPVPERAVE